MGTNEYLKKLDLNQLLYAKEKAEELIAAKRGEEKVTIYRVLNHSLCYGNFAEADYMEAVNCLALEAERLELEGADDYEKTLSIQPQHVPASEAGDYLK